MCHQHLLRPHAMSQVHISANGSTRNKDVCYCWATESFSKVWAEAGSSLLGAADFDAWTCPFCTRSSCHTVVQLGRQRPQAVPKEKGRTWQGSQQLGQHRTATSLATIAIVQHRRLMHTTQDSQQSHRQERPSHEVALQGRRRLLLGRCEARLHRLATCGGGVCV